MLRGYGKQGDVGGEGHCVLWSGLALVIVALVLGVASTALGANGGNFILLAQNNTASLLTMS